MKFIRKYWILILIGVITLAAILVYVFRCKLFPALASCVEDPNKNNIPVPPGSPTTTWVKESFPLNVGMFGPKIKALQKALGFQDTNKNEPNFQDGYFGDKETKPAVINAGYSVPISEPDYNKIIAVSAEFIGKNAYALINDVRVSNLDNSVYKIAKKDEWCGKVSGKEGDFYLLSGNRKVGTGSVYLK